MIQHTQTIFRLLPMNCLSAFDCFAELALKGLNAPYWLQVCKFAEKELFSLELSYSLQNNYFSKRISEHSKVFTSDSTIKKNHLLAPVLNRKLFQLILAHFIFKPQHYLLILLFLSCWNFTYFLNVHLIALAFYLINQMGFMN